MPGLEGEIRWGAGYDNALQFAYPQSLDDAKTYRKPVPGSQRIRTPAGVVDVWEEARDFMLSSRFRYFNRAAWGGSGLQDFLDNAKDQPFRFIPDRNYPSFYVDNCYLDAPYDDPVPDLEAADGSQSINAVIRNQAFDLGLAMRGLMFEYVPGKSLTDPSSALATFSRATTGYQIGRDGTLLLAGAGVLRDRHFVGGVRSTLLEKASTNLVASDLSAWTVVAGVRTAVADPADGASAVKLIGSAGNPGALQYPTATIPGIVADGTKSFSIAVKQGNATTIQLRFVDGTTGANRMWAYVTFTAGVPALGGGSPVAPASLNVQALKNGWYLLAFTVSGVVAANNNTLIIYSTNSGVDTDYTYYFLPCVENANMPSMLMPIGLTRPADSLQFPWAFGPQEKTIYLKVFELGTMLSSSSEGFFGLGQDSANEGNPSIDLYPLSDTSIRCGLLGGAVGGGNLSVTKSGLTVAIAQALELRVTYDSARKLNLGVSIAGGAESTTGLSAASEYLTAWQYQSLVLGRYGGGPGRAASFPLVRIAAGTKTLAQMRAA